jgi:hypothetical protein
MNWTDFIIAIKQGLIPSKKELVDGTTTVGNANKLGGKGASEYFLKSGGDIDGTLHARGATDTPIYNHANSSTDESYIGYAVGDILRGYIGFKNGKAHIHNVGDIATTADLANYLPKNDAVATTFTIEQDGMIGIPCIRYRNGGTMLGYLGIRRDGQLAMWDGSAQNMKTYIHDGNVGDYAAGSAYGLIGHYGTDNGGILYNPNYGGVRYTYNVDSYNEGIFPTSSNANSVLTLNRHAGDYTSQLGFSSNGCLYYRTFDGEAIHASKTWREILDTGNSAKVAIQSTAPTDTSALWVW